MAAAVLHCNGDSVNHEGWTVTYQTSSSAAAEGPRKPLSQLKSCQLLHNCTKNHIWLEGLPFHVV